jgi:SAM-dependent methyltransferase
MPLHWTDLVRSQVEMLSLAEGFFASNVIFALLRMGAFRSLQCEAKTVSEIAQTVGGDPASLKRLLNGAVALKILEVDGERYRIRPQWCPLLADSDSEGYLGNWLGFLDYVGMAVSRLDDAVRTAGPTVDLLGIRDRKSIREFILAMHDFASLRGRDIANSLDTSNCHSILDVGCGPGTYAFLLGMANSRLEIHLADFPEVLEVAAEVQRRFPLENSVRYLPADVIKATVPGVYDLVLVSNTLHMLGAEDSPALLKRLYHSVSPGGSLVVQAQFLDDDRRGGRWPVLLDLIQLCITERGHNHSVPETTEWLREAGFERIEYRRLSVYNTNSYLRAYRDSR